MKVNIFKEEWYPVYEIYEEANSSWTTEIELTEKELGLYKEAHKKIEEIQQIIAKKIAEKRHQ